MARRREGDAALLGMGDDGDGQRMRRAASAAAAMRSTSVASLRASGTISVTFGLPSVSVPVLSKAMACTLPIASSTPPPLTSRPRRAPAASAEAIAAGVEMTSAQGQPMSSSAKRAVDPCPPVGSHDQRRNDRDGERQRTDRRHVIARERVDEALGRRLGICGFLDQLDDARDERVLGLGFSPGSAASPRC